MSYVSDSARKRKKHPSRGINKDDIPSKNSIRKARDKKLAEGLKTKEDVEQRIHDILDGSI